MSDSKHTPGPWILDESHHKYCVNWGENPAKHIAMVNMFNDGSKTGVTPKEAEANAALIASAPALKAENERLTKKILTLKERSKLHERVFSETIAIIGPLESQNAALLAACELAYTWLYQENHSEEGQEDHVLQVKAAIEKARTKS